jgi:hypothetical protein
MQSGRDLERSLGPDFRLRIRQRQDQRLARHLRDHLGLEHAGTGQAEEDIGALDDVGERARIRRARVALLVRIGIGPARIDHAAEVCDRHVFLAQSHRDQQVEAGERRGAGARARDLDLADVLADHLEPVEHCGRDDDRRAVLVVVEHRDLHALAQLPFDVEALRRLDVLEVDAAERGLEGRDNVDEPIRVVLGNLDVEHVDAREFLEQAPLAFHDRLRGKRADVAEAQHRGAVRDHGHEVGARGHVRRFERIVLDQQARVRNAGRIRQRKIALVGQRLGRRQRDLSGRGQAVIIERGFLELFFHERFPHFSARADFRSWPHRRPKPRQTLAAMPAS